MMAMAASLRSRAVVTFQIPWRTLSLLLTMCLVLSPGEGCDPWKPRLRGGLLISLNLKPLSQDSPGDDHISPCITHESMKKKKKITTQVLGGLRKRFSP